MDKEKFLAVPQDGLKKWAILIRDGKTYKGDLTDQQRGSVALLRSCGHNMGIPIDDVSDVFEAHQAKDQNELAIEWKSKMLRERVPGLQIVVVTLSGWGPGSKDAYG